MSKKTKDTLSEEASTGSNTKRTLIKYGLTKVSMRSKYLHVLLLFSPLPLWRSLHHFSQ